MATRQRLRVYLDGIPIGDAEQTGGSLSFTYDEEYRSGPNATPSGRCRQVKPLSFALIRCCRARPRMVDLRARRRSCRGNRLAALVKRPSLAALLAITASD